MKAKKPIIGGFLVWLVACIGFAAYGGNATSQEQATNECGTYENIACDVSLAKHESAIAAANAKYEADVAAYLQAVQVQQFIDAVNFVKAVQYAIALEEAHAAEHARAAARPAPRSAPRTSGGSVGGACGGSKYDAVIPDESGGNPNARNSSGAWGCYQIMPGTWAGSCSDLGAHGSASVEAQAACADRLPGNSWVASGHSF